MKRTDARGLAVRVVHRQGEDIGRAERRRTGRELEGVVRHPRRVVDVDCRRARQRPGPARRVRRGDPPDGVPPTTTFVRCCSCTVGSGGFTFTTADRDACPPSPETVRVTVNVPGTVQAAATSAPDIVRPSPSAHCQLVTPSFAVLRSVTGCPARTLDADRPTPATGVMGTAGPAPATGAVGAEAVGSVVRGGAGTVVERRTRAVVDDPGRRVVRIGSRAVGPVGSTDTCRVAVPWVRSHAIALEATTAIPASTATSSCRCRGTRVAVQPATRGEPDVHVAEGFRRRRPHGAVSIERGDHGAAGSLRETRDRSERALHVGARVRPPPVSSSYVIAPSERCRRRVAATRRIALLRSHVHGCPGRGGERRGLRERLGETEVGEHQHLVGPRRDLVGSAAPEQDVRRLEVAVHEPQPVDDGDRVGQPRRERYRVVGSKRSRAREAIRQAAAVPRAA